MTLRSRLLALLLAAAAAGVVAPGASAHATLERTSPGDGSRVAYSPSELRLWFSEDVSSRFREIRVVDGEGRLVQGATVTGDGRLVVVELPRLGDGTYGVIWHVLSEDDGHVTGGSLAFGVGAGPVVASSGSEGGRASFSRVEAVLRWLDFSLLAGVVGCLAVAALVLPRARRSATESRAALEIADRRLLRAGIACAVLAVGAGVARLALALARAVGEARRRGLLAREHRRPSCSRAAGVGCGWFGSWRCSASPGCFSPFAGATACGLPATRGRVSVAGVLLVVAGAAHAMTSHAAALERATATAVVGDAVHVLAAATWLGGVAALGLALWPAGKLERPDSATWRAPAGGRSRSSPRSASAWSSLRGSTARGGRSPPSTRSSPRATATCSSSRPASSCWSSRWAR